MATPATRYETPTRDEFVPGMRPYRGIVGAQKFIEPHIGLDQSIIPFSLRTPAAGADFAAFTFSGGSWWFWATFQARFQTSIVAATRAPRMELTIGDNPGTPYAGTGTVTFAASQDVRIVGGRFYPQAGAAGAGSNIIHMPLPDMPIPPGHRIIFSTNGLDAGDTWTLGNVGLLRAEPPARRVT